VQCEYTTRRARVLRSTIRGYLINHLGGFICVKCNINEPTVLMIVYKEFNGSKNKGVLTNKRINYYNENIDEANNDLIILCHNCERRKRNDQRPTNNASWQKYGRIARHKRRLQIFDILNQKTCQKCGEDDFQVLEIDHINDPGNRTLKDKFKNKDNEHRYYINHTEQCKKDLQILCCNCNHLKGL